MQEELSKNSPIEVSQKRVVSIGALLINARNHAALGQGDVADQINLSVRIIKALENDDYENLPESTYIRGYLRNYARAVEVDAEGLITAYNEQHHVENNISSQTGSKHSYDSAILWSTAAVFTILIGLLVNWWVDVKHAPVQSIEVVDVNNDSVAVSDNAADEINTQNSNIANNRVTEVSELPAKEVANQFPLSEEPQAIDSSSNEMINAEVEQAMEDESLNPTLVSMSDGSAVLTVTYVQKSWTEIRDADLNPLMQGLIEPGVVKNLSGKAPFYIFLGNSPGVVIEVNGQYFDHSQFSRSNRTARFEVSNESLN